MLHKSGNIDQLAQCGLTTIRRQMQFKKAVIMLLNDGEQENSDKSIAKTEETTTQKLISSRHKLSKEQLKKISAEEQRLYLKM